MDFLTNKAIELVITRTGSGTRCVLSQLDADGYPTSSTITASKAHGLSEIFFCTGLGSYKVKRVELDDRASVCFSDDDYNVNLVGKITVVTDPEIKTVMWYKGLENHFRGPDDPEYCVLKFTTQKYNFLVDWQEVRGII